MKKTTKSKGIPKTPEHRAKIAKALRGKKLTAERRANISKACKGRIPWNKGLTKSTSKAVARNAEATRQTVQKKWDNGEYQGFIYAGNFKKTEGQKIKISKSHIGVKLSKDALKKRKKAMDIKSFSFSIQKAKYGLSNLTDENAKKIIRQIIISEFEQQGYTVVLNEKYFNTKDKINYTCPKGHQGSIRINNWREGQRCSHCSNQKSKDEQAIFDFITKNLTTEAVNRYRPPFMEGKELDIYIPEHNLAIEYCGLYWHTTQYRKKYDHRDKYNLCKKEGISLFTVFSDEWLNNPELIKKMIEYRCHKLEGTKISASACILKELSKQEEKDFFGKYHLAGHSASKYSYGLFHNEELVSAISFRKPYTKKDCGSIEICRFANNYAYIVHGGFSRLFKNASIALKAEGFNRVITYSDCRLGDGSVYKQQGFEYVSKTPPNYWYTEGKVREFRFKHRRQDRLSDLGSTEKEQTQAQGLFPIFDCGSYKWTKAL